MKLFYLTRCRIFYKFQRRVCTFIFIVYGIKDYCGEVTTLGLMTSKFSDISHVLTLFPAKNIDRRGKWTKYNKSDYFNSNISPTFDSVNHMFDVSMGSRRRTTDRQGQNYILHLHVLCRHASAYVHQYDPDGSSDKAPYKRQMQNIFTRH